MGLPRSSTLESTKLHASSLSQIIPKSQSFSTLVKPQTVTLKPSLAGKGLDSAGPTTASNMAYTERVPVRFFESGAHDYMVGVGGFRV